MLIAAVIQISDSWWSVSARQAVAAEHSEHPADGDHERRHPRRINVQRATLFAGRGASIATRERAGEHLTQIFAADGPLRGHAVRAALVVGGILLAVWLAALVFGAWGGFGGLPHVDSRGSDEQLLMRPTRSPRAGGETDRGRHRRRRGPRPGRAEAKPGAGEVERLGRQLGHGTEASRGGTDYAVHPGPRASPWARAPATAAVSPPGPRASAQRARMPAGWERPMPTAPRRSG